MEAMFGFTISDDCCAFLKGKKYLSGKKFGFPRTNMKHKQMLV